MRQLTFAIQPSFEKYARASRREQFLQTMETVVPWSELEAEIAAHSPKAGRGRQPAGLSIMLRIYFLQHWFSLSDPAAEDALYDSPALRRFVGVDLGRAAAPDESYSELSSSA
jgi:IS5 family transposase